MSQSHHIPKKPLILALLTGICADASVALLSHSVVPFSFFPIIAFGLAAYQLLQYYRVHPMLGNTPICTLLGFLIGIFGHSSLLKVQYPELGSNFFALIMTLLLLAALSIKLGLSVDKVDKKAG
ncbi:DUF1422 family protein [Aeromonas cavernicola]|uniref:YijD family membrane protein n=1 Tax=Aeromonas cavernicola TaxID=1006623 RepID=A0A2H9U694_9GAMM|nr:DUF1422 family protein [Aeromonas cavernicola]PJG59576.1 hypothetical protein CUC53_06510 [Aeromonas cavernicola]